MFLSSHIATSRDPRVRGATSLHVDRSSRLARYNLGNEQERTEEEEAQEAKDPVSCSVQSRLLVLSRKNSRSSSSGLKNDWRVCSTLLESF